MKFGLYTLLIESQLRVRLPGFGKFDFGWGNGYVLIPHNHPFYGVNYNDIYDLGRKYSIGLDDSIDVHGGLTFSEYFDVNRFLEWIKDLEIDGDVTKENYEKFNNYWMIGFDTGHFGDSMETCPKFYVFSETNNLLEQCLSDSIDGMKKYKSFYERKDKLKKIAIDKEE